ncbi:hypothetical protein [Amycolatopsis methanolica]|uniref:hypothetical protein n=1 Tax=Amycolatopsis methanolica TaxID=1814 RepID=UPI0003AA7AB2|nr:hypothetical protein [Amycolatopsis methanolica]
MRTKKWLLTCGVLAVIAIVTAAIVVLCGRPDSTPAGDDVAAAVGQYLRTWSDGDDRQAGALTDDPRGAGAALAASRSGLGASAVTATLQGVSGDSARVRVKWTLGAGPGVDLRQRADRRRGRRRATRALHPGGDPPEARRG